MKIFYNYIREIFNTKQYTWEKNIIQDIATFKYDDKVFKVHFDEILDNVYNLYFFYIDENGEEAFKLTNDNKHIFKIFSNIVNAVDDFIENHPYMEFIGFSAYENERKNIYMLFLQRLVQTPFNYSIIDKKKKIFYFLYSNNIDSMIKETYIDKFIIEDNKNKK